MPAEVKAAGHPEAGTRNGGHRGANDVELGVVIARRVLSSGSTAAAPADDDIHTGARRRNARLQADPGKGAIGAGPDRGGR